MTKTEIDRFCHATSGAAARGRAPGRQILFYFGVRPCAYASLTVRSDVVGLPPVNDRSGVFPATLRREHQIAGGVAIAAVRKRADQAMGTFCGPRCSMESRIVSDRSGTWLRGLDTPSDLAPARSRQPLIAMKIERLAGHHEAREALVLSVAGVTAVMLIESLVLLILY
jgi:hypothetical protein